MAGTNARRAEQTPMRATRSITLVMYRKLALTHRKLTVGKLPWVSADWSEFATQGGTDPYACDTPNYVGNVQKAWTSSRREAAK